MREIQKLNELFSTKDSSLLLKRKLQYIVDLYNSCESSSEHSIIREILENCCELMIILDKSKKVLTADDIPWDPEAEGYEDDTVFQTDFVEAFDPENYCLVFEAYSAFLRVKGLREATIRDYTKRLKRFLREYKEDNICVDVSYLYEEIERILADYRVSPENIERNKKSHGGEIAAMKKFRDMKEYINNRQRQNRLIQDVNNYINEYYVESSNRNFNYLKNIFTNNHPATQSYLTSIQEKELFDHVYNLDKSFNDLFREHIHKYEKDNPNKYKNIERFCEEVLHIRRNVYYKMMDYSKIYHPDKKTVYLVALGLQLSLDETIKLLGTAGYSISHSDKFDLAMEHFFKTKNYNYNDIEYALGKLGLNALTRGTYKTKRDEREEETYKRTEKSVE